MVEVYNRTRKDGASGIDNVIAEEYSANLEESLKALLGLVLIDRKSFKTACSRA
jgi:hypothetical protein